MTSDKQQVSYESSLHPSRSSSTIKYTQPLLLDSALLEKKSRFAQKTLQRPLSFVGKLFQGLSDITSASQIRPESITNSDGCNKERDKEDDNNDVTEYDYD